MRLQTTSEPSKLLGATISVNTSEIQTLLILLSSPFLLYFLFLSFCLLSLMSIIWRALQSAFMSSLLESSFANVCVNDSDILCCWGGGNFTNASVANGLSSLCLTDICRAVSEVTRVSAEPRSWQLSASSLTLIQCVIMWRCIWSKNNAARWPEHETDHDFRQPSLLQKYVYRQLHCASGLIHTMHVSTLISPNTLYILY